MKSQYLVFAFPLLFGLALSVALAGTPSPSERRAALVAVVNTTPTDPLGGEIWLMDLSGRLVRRITQNRYHEEYPSFSPDGNKIAFVRNTGGIVPEVGLDRKNDEIFVYDLRAGVETRLTRNNFEDGHPEWSFDGKWIVFHSRRHHPEEKATLWIMGADGSQPRQISALLSGDLAHLHPNFGPDGHWVAFANYREEDGHRYARVEKIRLDGSQRTVVSSGGRHLRAKGVPKDEMLGDLEPAHSPDGAMIWAARKVGKGSVQLFSFGAGAYYGGKAEMGMDGPFSRGAVERSPRFAPDGRRLLLTRLSPDAGLKRRQVVLTDPQSSFRRYLTSRENWDAWHPRWHPFASSGAEHEDAGKLKSHQASPVDWKNLTGTGPRLPGSESLHAASELVEPPGVKASPAGVYEKRWKIDQAERISSMNLRYEGTFRGEGMKSLGFQLMDWSSNSWVTVFVRSGIAAGPVAIEHELAPADFVSHDTREVWLRVVSPGGPFDSWGVETRQLTLEVNYTSSTVQPG